MPAMWLKEVSDEAAGRYRDLVLVQFIVNLILLVILSADTALCESLQLTLSQGASQNIFFTRALLPPKYDYYM